MNINKFLLFIAIFMVFIQKAKAYEILFIVDARLALDANSQQVMTQKMAEWSAEISLYYEDSGIDMQAEMTGVIFKDISGGGMVTDGSILINNMKIQTSGFQNIQSLADEYGADFIVAIFGELSGVCGKAYVAANINQYNSFSTLLSVNKLACGSHTVAHELGHNMGLNHGHFVKNCAGSNGIDALTSITPYALGYAEADCDKNTINSNEFGSIMVGNYLWTYSGSNNIANLFSTLRIKSEQCGNDGVCGDVNTANVARAIDEHRHYFEQRNAPDVHMLTYQDASLTNCIKNYYKGKEIDELLDFKCSHSGIMNISGIEQLTSVRTIDLSDNNITDLTPILRMNQSNLTYIDLSSNDQIQCEQLNAIQKSSHVAIHRPTHCVNVAALMSIINFIILND